MINPVSQAVGATSPLATAAASQVDKDMFMNLMVTQLRNQDPMNPTDSADFLAQTAQFTSLEKLQEVAAASAQALSAQMAFGASSLVGRTVTYEDADGVEVTGSVTSVRFTPDGPLLGVGADQITLDRLVKVEATPTG